MKGGVYRMLTKLVPDGNGRPVMEINGLRQKEEAAV